MPEPLRPLITKKVILGGVEMTAVNASYAITTPLANTMVYDVKLESMDWFADGERRPDMQYMGTVDSTLGKVMGKLTFKQDLSPGDAFLLLITGCGYTETDDVMHPSSDMSTRKFWAFKAWEDGRVKGLKNASGTFKLSGTNGGRVTLDWEWTGIWVAPTDEAMPAQTPIQAQPYMVKALTLTLGGSVLPLVSKFTVDIGAQIQDREDVTAAHGVLCSEVIGRDPSVTLDPEARKVADHNAYGLMLAGTTGALSIVLTNGTTTMTIGAPRAQRTQITGGDRNNKRTDELTLKCHESSGDDSMTFTEAAGS